MSDKKNYAIDWMDKLKKKYAHIVNYDVITLERRLVVSKRNNIITIRMIII